jgi:uroporphyrinogen-III decarboxylase
MQKALLVMAVGSVPWVTVVAFKEWVYTFDKPVNDAIHAIGGKHRSHCHGNCMEFLEVMAEMGVDSIEPLEPPPFGNVNLAEAKRRLHGRMLLSGNVMSNLFNRLTDPAETRDMVKRAIDDAAAGGGFTLRTTGGHAGLADNLTAEQQRNVILNIEAYVDTGLEYGKY